MKYLATMPVSGTDSLVGSIPDTLTSSEQATVESRMTAIKGVKVEALTKAEFMWAVRQSRFPEPLKEIPAQDWEGAADECIRLHGCCVNLKGKDMFVFHGASGVTFHGQRERYAVIDSVYEATMMSGYPFEVSTDFGQVKCKAMFKDRPEPMFVNITTGRMMTFKHMLKFLYAHAKAIQTIR